MMLNGSCIARPSTQRLFTAGSGELGATVMAAEALTMIQEDDGVSVVLDQNKKLGAPTIQ